jgi:hypothetical protein
MSETENHDTAFPVHDGPDDNRRHEGGPDDDRRHEGGPVVPDVTAPAWGRLYPWAPGRPGTVGRPGSGKSHLDVAIGTAALRAAAPGPLVLLDATAAATAFPTRQAEES